MAAVYLYGVLRAPASIPPPETRGVGASSVRIFEDRSLATVVGDLPDGEFRARRADLMAHSDVLQEVFSSVDVLPMRFGTVFSLTDELLDAFLRPNETSLIQILDRVRGASEIQLKGEYEPDAIAREIVVDDRAIQKLKARVKSRGDVDSKIELGRRFATALDERRYADGHQVVEALAQLAEDVAVGDPAGEYGVLNASFLVPRERVQRFEAAVEETRAALAGRVNLRQVGPLPPYSFVEAGSMAVG
jgi:hypothetical protein